MAKQLHGKKYSIFSFLLLPVFLSVLLVACNKKNKEEASAAQSSALELSEEKNASLEETDFYSPAEDDASWVDSLLARVEEERIAEELARMEESLSEYQLEDVPETESASSEAEVSSSEDESSKEEEIDPIEKFFEEAEEGRVIRGKNNELRFYEFQNETLSPQITENGYTLIHSSNESVQRYFYDLQYKLIKKEDWIIKSAADSKLKRSEEFVYSAESGKVIQKSITTETLYETISYNKESSPVSLQSYELKDKERYIVNERKWTYDDKNQLIKDEQKEYKYKNEDYDGPVESLVRSYEYTYYDLPDQDKSSENSKENKSEKSKKSEIPPDLKYYENNELKMQYNYTNVKGNYYTWVYFDENFSVKTFYEDDVKVLEEFYNNGRLVRTKAYDKMD